MKRCTRDGCENTVEGRRRICDSCREGLPTFGPVESKVRADVGALFSAHPMGEAIAELAFALARTLDEGAGLAVAAVGRELRACLVELARTVIDDDDDLESRLSSPVRDPEEP